MVINIMERSKAKNGDRDYWRTCFLNKAIRGRFLEKVTLIKYLVVGNGMSTVDIWVKSPTITTRASFGVLMMGWVSVRRLGG